MGDTTDAGDVTYTAAGDLPLSLFSFDIYFFRSSYASKTKALLHVPGQHLRKLAVDVSPFAFIHSIVGFAPLTSGGSQKYPAFTRGTQQMWYSENTKCTDDPRLGPYVAASTMGRCKMSIKEVDELMISILSLMISILSKVKSSVCDIPPKCLKMASTFSSSSTSAQDVCEKPTAMFRREAFVLWYISSVLLGKDARSDMKLCSSAVLVPNCFADTVNALRKSFNQVQRVFAEAELLES